MKKILLILSILLLLLLSLFYMMFNGTPWGLYAVRQDAAQYLQERYATEMVIAEVDYTLSDGHYFVRAHPKGNEELLFLVNKYENRDSEGYFFTDDYMRQRWTYEIDSEIGPFTKSTFSEHDGAFVFLSGDNLYEQFKDKKNITEQEIPTYQQVRETLVEGSRINIFIQRDFDSNHADEEYQRVLDVVNFIKDKQYPVGLINFAFAQDTDSAEEWSKVKHTYFDIPIEKLPDIKTKEDIKAVQR